MLYEFVTGKALYDFPGDDDGSMTLARVHNVPELTDDERELFLQKAKEKGFDSDKLLGVLEKSHAKDPMERFESPEALSFAVSDARTNSSPS